MHEDAFTLLNRYVSVSRETFDRLVLYHDLLLKWQVRVNLVGPDSIREAWSRHFLDSLQLLAFLPSLDVRLMDIGSGAGFPGMALAIAGVSDVHLVESDQKKIIFLKEVSRITDTKITCHPKRVEQVSLNAVDVITSRACSDLDTLLGYSSSNVSHETICLFPKGKNYITEVENAFKHWSFQYIVGQSITDTQGVVLKITDLRRGYESSNTKRD